MRVHVVDPPAYTPPYDHALAAALARAGAQVTLVTSAFRHGERPEPEGYELAERFYGRAGGAARLARHVPDMLRYRRFARAADVVHWQWLPLPQIDWRLARGDAPRVLTAHDVLPREPRPGQRGGAKRLLRSMDAVVVHSEAGARRLVSEVGVGAERVHVIPHGPFDHLARNGVGSLPRELGAPVKPVVLFFGLIRPYKGLDVLVEAWRRLDPDAELWVVGAPRGVDLDPLRAAAGPKARWVPRFVSDAELGAIFRAAAVAVLPYREIDQSGVLYTALAFNTPLVLSDVGGFAEISGAAHVPPDDPEALARALAQQLERPTVPAPVPGWDEIARRTLALYGSLLT